MSRDADDNESPSGGSFADLPPYVRNRRHHTDGRHLECWFMIAVAPPLPVMQTIRPQMELTQARGADRTHYDGGPCMHTKRALQARCSLVLGMQHIRRLEGSSNSMASRTRAHFS